MVACDAVREQSPQKARFALRDEPCPFSAMRFLYRSINQAPLKPGLGLAKVVQQADRGTQVGGPERGSVLGRQLPDLGQVFR